jgi:hypothetical protein
MAANRLHGLAAAFERGNLLTPPKMLTPPTFSVFLMFTHHVVVFVSASSTIHLPSAPMPLTRTAFAILVRAARACQWRLMPPRFYVGASPLRPSSLEPRAGEGTQLTGLIVIHYSLRSARCQLYIILSSGAPPQTPARDPECGSLPIFRMSEKGRRGRPVPQNPRAWVLDPAPLWVGLLEICRRPLQLVVKQAIHVGTA